MRTTKLAALAVFGAFVAASVAACGSSSDGEGGGGEIKIGHLLPITGANATYAPASEKAAELALGELQSALKENDATDISVSMLTEDEQTSEQGAVQAARKVVAEGANILVGVWTSGGTLAAANAVAIPDGIALITPVSTSTTLTALDDDGLVSRIIPADNVQALSVAKVAAEEVGPDATLSLAGVNAPYGAGFAADFLRVWEEGGGKTTGTVLYDPNQAEFDSEVSEIVAGDPDGYVFFDYPESFAKASRSLLRSGTYNPSKAFFPEAIGSLDSLSEAGIVPAALEGATGTQPAAPAGTQSGEAFDELFKSSDLDPAERFTYDANTFDIVVLAGLAGIAAGSSDPAAIAEQVPQVSSAPGKKFTFEQLPAAVEALLDGEQIDYEGVTGPLEMDANGDLVPEAAIFNKVTFDQAGNREVIEQFNLAETE